MKMAIKRINITIRTNRQYGDVAILVDRPKFLKRMVELRNKYSIDPTFKETYLEFIFRLQTARKYRDFEKDITNLRRSLDFPSNFSRVVEKAIICNEVSNKDYKSAYLEEIPTSNDPESPDTKYAIIISSLTLKKDVDEVFDNFKSDLKINKEKYKEPSEIDYHSFLLGPKFEYEKSKIKRDREWYWQEKSSKQYKDILEDWNKKCPDPSLDNHYDACKHCVADQNKIEQAVSRYKKLINLS